MSAADVRQRMEITVVSGGPTDVETAALVAAVLATAAAVAGPKTPTTPAWAKAARIEATGQAPLAASNDPRLTVYSTVI